LLTALANEMRSMLSGWLDLAGSPTQCGYC